MGNAERPAAALAIALLGPLDVRLQGHPLPRLRSRKSQWLLALLTLQAGRAVDRSWLAGVLWPDSSEEQAAFNLRRNLRDLRHSLGPEGRRIAAPTMQTLQLDLVGAEADVLIFDEAIARGDTLSLEQAVALHRAPLLTGCLEDWVLQEREAREQAYLAALETLAAHALASGDPGKAVRYLRRLIVADPLRDSVQRALMQALADAGDVAAATQAYRDFRLHLHRELNATPDAETTALYEQIRTAAKERASRVPSGRKGERAREGSETGSRSALYSGFPLARSPARPLARSLPRPLSSFVGRDWEIADLAAALEAARLVTLTGTGGVGKTRLAIRVAEEVALEYPDGVAFIGLAPLADATLVPDTAARALGLAESTERTPTETLLDALRQRRLLLVLDNCEHLRDACAELVEALLGGCPSLTVMATSRQSLGLTGETAWRVEPLSLPGPREGSRIKGQGSGVEGQGSGVKERGPTPGGVTLKPIHSTLDPRPSALLQSDAVRLFVERAVATLRTFQLTEANASAVVEVCRQLDGIPLAIELAAARLKALSVPELAQRLDDRFRLLTHGSRTAPPRQQSLQAALDWSYNQLPEPERALLRRTAVFAGGWTLAAAEAVCGDPVSSERDGSRQQAEGRRQKADSTESTQRATRSHRPDCLLPSAFCLLPSAVLDLLTALVDKSLVQFEEREAGGWYRLLETVRQYARERLRESGEEERLRARHYEHHVRVAEEAARKLWGPEQLDCLERLHAAHDDMRAALEWSLAEAPALVLRLAGALSGFWRQRSHLQEGRRWLLAALERAGPARNSQAGALALDGAGILALCEGDIRAAHLLFLESLEIARKLDDRAAMAHTLGHVSPLIYDMGDPAKARAMLEEGLAFGRETRSASGVATVLLGLGYVAYHEGEFAAARSHFQENLVIVRELGDREGVGTALTRLGEVALRLGEFSAARKLYIESLELWRALGDRRGIAAALQDIGEVAAKQGLFAEAQSLYEEAIAIWRDLGAQSGRGIALHRLSDLAEAQKDYAQARRFREEALAMWRARGHQMAVIHSLGALGHYARKEGDFPRARSLYAESLVMRVEANDTHAIIASLEDFADLAIAEQQWARVTTLLGAVMALREATGKAMLPRWHAHYLEVLGQARAALSGEEYAVAWAEGQAMTMAEAVCNALATDEGVAGNQPRVGSSVCFGPSATLAPNDP